MTHSTEEVTEQHCWHEPGVPDSAAR